MNRCLSTDEWSQGETPMECGVCLEDAAAYGPKREPDLKVRAYRFCVSLLKWASSVERGRISDVVMQQLVRAGTSVGANIVEAKAGSSRRDFTRYLEIALKSANETLFWLCLTRDAGIAERDQVATLVAEMKEIAKMLGASILTLKGKR